jgi:hypothetical protein
MDKPARMCFTRMQSSYHEDSFLSFIGFVKVSYCQNRYLYTRQALAQYFFLKNLTVFLVFRFFLYILNSFNKIDQHCKAIWNCIRKPNFILVIFKCKFECHLVPYTTKKHKKRMISLLISICLILTAQFTMPILYILSDSMPPNPLTCTF